MSMETDMLENGTETSRMEREHITTRMETGEMVEESSSLFVSDLKVS